VTVAQEISGQQQRDISASPWRGRAICTRGREKSRENRKSSVPAHEPRSAAASLTFDERRQQSYVSRLSPAGWKGETYLLELFPQRAAPIF